MLTYDILKDQLDNGANGIIILNKDKQVIYQNKVAEKIFKSTTKSLIGNYIKCNNTVREIVNCQNTTRCNICVLNIVINRVIETGKSEKLSNINLDTDLLEKSVNIEIRKIEDNISLEFINGSEKTRQVNILYNLIDKSKDIMYYKDFKLRYLCANSACSEAFNVKREKMIFKTDKELLKNGFMDKKTYDYIIETDILTLEKGYYTGIERHGDKYFNVFKEAVGEGLLCISKEITGEVTAIKESELDILTSLSNRRRLLKDIKEIFSKKDENYYLALIDLDNLRNINNRLGHFVGDKCLRSLSEVLLMYTNANFYRVGGDEFAALIKGEKEEVEKVIKGIFDKLESLEIEEKFTISVGIKRLNINIGFLENYQQVDELMYKIKRNGKNGYIIV